MPEPEYESSLSQLEPNKWFATSVEYGNLPQGNYINCLDSSIQRRLGGLLHIRRPHSSICAAFLLLKFKFKRWYWLLCNKTLSNITLMYINYYSKFGFRGNSIWNGEADVMMLLWLTIRSRSLIRAQHSIIQSILSDWLSVGWSVDWIINADHELFNFFMLIISLLLRFLSMRGLGEVCAA